MVKEFRQIHWDERLQADCRAIVQLALDEDLGVSGDWTTKALVPEGVEGRAEVAARQSGVVAGLPAVEIVLAMVDPRLRWTADAVDGQTVDKGQCVGRIAGPARAMLAAERIVLNLLGRLSGIAALTRRHVDAAAGTKARIYDTRKTTPGWRRLEKYAVRCGGGHNHRGGLDEAVLIKDNHLAIVGREGMALAPADAVDRVRRYLVERGDPTMIVEVEVDTLDQLDQVLPARPDLVLLDNMSAAELREAVARRDAVDPTVELEASGGIDLETVRAAAQSGVERISVGALTHAAVSLDFGLDWTM